MTKRILRTLILVLLVLDAQSCESVYSADPKASRVRTDTTNFDNNLSSADDTVQKALETLDELAGGGGGSGDITQVWSDTSGDVSGMVAASGDTFDASAADSSIVSVQSTTLPGTCSEGMEYHDTDSGGTERYVCTATNTWTKYISPSDNVATATALAANGSNCSSGLLAAGVNESGGSEGCEDPILESEMDDFSEFISQVGLTGTASGSTYLAGDGDFKTCVEITGSADLCDGSDDGAGGGGTVTPGICMGRLTLTDGTPVTTSDVTNSDNLYFENYKGEHCAVYDGSSAWQWVNLGSGLTITNSGLSNDTNYDVFLDYNGGSAQLALTAWTDATNRATALTLQDGAYVQTGNTDWLYLGTVRTDASGNDFEDSLTKRFVWNNYNRLERQLRRYESTASWTYNSTSYRQARADASNQIEVVVGLEESNLNLRLTVLTTAGGSDAALIGIGEDSTTSLSSYSNEAQVNFSVATTLTAGINRLVPLGYHKYVWLEKIAISAAGTFSGGSKNGLSGNVDA